ncbi:MAG: hypothetical protein QM802_04110 [Agriterribacter sp.]
MLFYFAPTQNEFYLEDDISAFKYSHLRPALTWLWIIICFATLMIAFIKSSSIKFSLNALLYISFWAGGLLFIFQDLFLAGALFLNRQAKKDSFSKNYVVEYIGIKSKESFRLYEASSEKSTWDHKLEDWFYTSGLTQNDTIAIPFNKGILGIEYPEKLTENQ